MHFFADHTVLPLQSASSDLYGPADPSIFNHYDVSANFQTTAVTKAFACQPGSLVVTDYVDATTDVVDPNLINLILKPDAGLKVNSKAVQYYIYRGIRKSDFFSGAAIAPADPSNIELISLMHAMHLLNLGLGFSALDPVDPKDFGYDSTIPDATKIEQIFKYAIPGVRPVRVPEGTYIGNFETGKKIGFEVIRDTGFVDVTVGYVKKSLIKLDVSTLGTVVSPSDAQKFELKVQREAILGYTDPAALFGMHWKVGVGTADYSSGSRETVVKKEQDLANDVLTKFASNGRIYLDIRSEKGNNYTYYDNYHNGNPLKIKFKFETQATFTEITYDSNSWPIFYAAIPHIDPATTLSYVDIQLRVDDNTKPVLFAENVELFGPANKKRFKGKKELLNGVATDWTNSIRLYFPTAQGLSNRYMVPNVLELYYFREEKLTPNPPVTNAVPLENLHLDTLFGAVDFTIPAVSVFGHLRNIDWGYSRGHDFAHVPETGMYFDANAVLLHSNARFAHIESDDVYPKIPPEQLGLTTPIGSTVVPKEIILNKWVIEETAGNNVNVLDIAAFNDKAKVVKKDHAYFLGLTRAEYTTLTGTAGFAPNTKRYLVLEKEAITEDVNGNPFQKYKLKLQGHDANGVRKIDGPATDVFVYSNGGSFLASKDFANLASLTLALPDPGTMRQWDHVNTITYDHTDAIIQAEFPTGYDNVDDLGNNQGTPNLDTELRAEVTFPVNAAGVVSTTAVTNISDTKPNYPLVVVVHGNGHEYTEYTRIREHLARNGFIAASIDCLEYSRKYTLTRQAAWPANIYIFRRDGTVYLYQHDVAPAARSVQRRVGAGWVATGWTHGVEYSFLIGPPGQIEVTILAKTYNHGMGAKGRMNVLFNHLKVIRRIFGGSVQNNIGLIGHSRGGESVVKAVAEITPALAHANLHTINAIMSLAPTDQYEEENLRANVPYYVLYGSRDGDVNGVAWSAAGVRYGRQGAAGKVGSGAFSLYDRAYDPSVQVSAKAMSFVHKATHNGFVTVNATDYPGPIPIPEATQRAIFHAYANAFFRQHLKTEPVWEPYFHGSHIPPSVPYRQIAPQFNRVGVPVKVVDDFQSNPPKGTSSSGGAVAYSAGAGKLTEGDLFSNDNHSPHETNGLIIEWNGGDSLTLDVPAALKNVQTLNFFSFRLGHVFAPGGAYSSLNTMKVGLTDIPGNPTHEVELTLNVPEPDHRAAADRPGSADNPAATKSALMTVRIPTDEYGNNGIDLTQVKQVVIKFPAAGSGKVAMDNIEFTN